MKYGNTFFVPKSQSHQHFPQTSKRNNWLQSQCVQCSSYGSNPRSVEGEQILKLCYNSWLKLDLKDLLGKEDGNTPSFGRLGYDSPCAVQHHAYIGVSTKIQGEQKYWCQQDIDGSLQLKLSLILLNVHLFSSKKQSQLLIIDGPQAPTFSSSFTLLIIALYCAIIGDSENTNNHIYFKWTLPAQSHGTIPLNRRSQYFKN